MRVSFIIRITSLACKRADASAENYNISISQASLATRFYRVLHRYVAFVKKPVHVDILTNPFGL